MKILIVDDSEKIRTALRNIIRTNLDADYEILEASDGLEALEKVPSFRPDIVLTDVLMPKMDGLQFTSILKSQPQTRGIFVAAITGLSGDEQIQKIYASGVDFYIAKPFQMEDIVARLKVITALIDKKPSYYEASWLVHNAYNNSNVKHSYLTFLIAKERDLFLIIDYFSNHKYYSDFLIIKELMVLLVKAYRCGASDEKEFKIILEESNDYIYFTFQGDAFISSLQKSIKNASEALKHVLSDDGKRFSIAIDVSLLLREKEDKAEVVESYSHEIFSAKDLISISSEQIQAYLSDVHEASVEFTKLCEGTKLFNEVMKFSYGELLDQYMFLFKKVPNFDRVVVALQSVSAAMKNKDVSAIDQDASQHLIHHIKVLNKNVDKWMKKVIEDQELEDVHYFDDNIMIVCHAIETIFK